ncbi:NUDIX hydrolase [Humibacter sp.]|jgi:8-oxo-dGTP pyrophosphatase MutT (NUDIX family)|uniref:NUDIX hydrolase n=1 Tax=Humibacter sp. TaxID=1940291 RepID=UPI002C7A4E62|nr:NUDIX domain-containing protein [Humibacter sp.]HVX07628.1 NUDIX domain-containing protein [Humibacter sp.]
MTTRAVQHNDEVIYDDLVRRLDALPPSTERDAFAGFVASGQDAALRRDGGPEHITASCFVFSPDLRSTLLCFHRKGGFWVQFGGHVEPEDESVADTALREAREESGIRELTLLTDRIVDLHRHELFGRFACSAHWDIGFVAIADPGATVTVSDESEDVRWFPVDELPADAAHELDVRRDLALRAATAVLG